MFYFNVQKTEMSFNSKPEYRKTKKQISPILRRIAPKP